MYMGTFCTICIDLKSLQNHLTIRTEDIAFLLWASWWSKSNISVVKREESAYLYQENLTRLSLLGTVHNFPWWFIRPLSMTEWHPLHFSQVWISPKNYQVGTNAPLKDLCLWVLPLVYISVTYNWQVGIRQIARGFCRSLHQPVWTFALCISKDGDCHGHNVVKTHLCLPKKRPLWLHKNGSIALLFHPTILHPEVGRLPEEHDIISRCCWCVPRTTEICQAWYCGDDHSC